MGQILLWHSVDWNENHGKCRWLICNDTIPYLHRSSHFSVCPQNVSHSHSKVDGKIIFPLSRRKFGRYTSFYSFVCHIEKIVICEVNKFILQLKVWILPIRTCKCKLCYKSDSLCLAHSAYSSNRGAVWGRVVLGIPAVSTWSLCTQYKPIPGIGCQYSRLSDERFWRNSSTYQLSYFWNLSPLWTVWGVIQVF